MTSTKYRLVPCEPTKEMIYAGEDSDRPAATYSGYSTIPAECDDHYRAMLAAAPRASEDEALVERVSAAVCGELDLDAYAEIPELNERGFPTRKADYRRVARAVLKMLEGE